MSEGIDNVICETAGWMLIDFDEPVLTVSMRVEARDGQLVITRVSSSFESTFDEAGPCRDNFWALACNMAVSASDRENMAREAVENQATRLFTMNRGPIEARLNARLRELGVSRPITLVTIDSDGNMSLVLEPES
jgi:hypothetical protein